MRKIVHVYDCGPEGEIEGIFENGKLLGWWSNNDANWRDEYFSGFMAELGIEVDSGSDNKKLIAKLRKAARQ